MALSGFRNINNELIGMGVAWSNYSSINYCYMIIIQQVRIKI